MSVHVLWVYLKNLVGHGDGFRLLDSTVLIDEGDAHISIYKRGPFLDDFIVGLDGLLVSCPIVEEVGIAYKKLNSFILG